MKIQNDYPKIRRKVNKFLWFRRISLLIFFISTIICGIINLAVGGKVWILYVLGAEIVFYFAFLNKPLIDNTLVKKITYLVFIICAYLYLINLIEDEHWSYFVINIICFSLVIIQLTMFFLEFKLQKKKFMPLFLTSIGSVIFCVLSITKVIKINWAIIVLGSLGLLVLLILFIFYRKMIVEDLKRYYSVK